MLVGERAKIIQMESCGAGDVNPPLSSLVKIAYMLTVAEALKLEQFAGAEVVAGKAGLSSPIAWVHIASVPDAPRWLNGGELVLTTGHNMPENPDDQRQYIQAMADKGVVGLVLSIGRYIDHAP